MPRFDKDGFNPGQRIKNDERDRSVPEEENYYATGSPDLTMFSTPRSGARPAPNDAVTPPQRSTRQQLPTFEPAVTRDVGEEQRRRNARNAAVQQKARKKKQAARVKRKAIIVAVIAVILILPVLLAGSVLGKINYDDHKKNEFIAASELKHDSSVKNILLLGVDARADEDTESSRADTMMLISVDTKHKCIKMTSFLRDTWVYLPAKDGEQRLNAASTYGGYAGVVDTIEYNFGVEIEGYVVADFQMFEVLVDSIGGVEVDVTEKEADEVTNHPDRYGDVVLEAGTHVLTGEQALAYCRIRKIDTDFNRTQRQRTVMTSILSEAKKGGIFTLYKMANASAKYIETDLSKAQLMTIAAAALPCLKGDMPQEKVPFDGTWEYANKGGASVIAINVDKNKELLIDYIYNQDGKVETEE